MRKLVTAAVLLGASITLSTGASAQATLSGEELRGHTVDVLFADGTRNAVFFGGNGNATIVSPTGLRSTGNWAVQNGNLCLNASGASECWTYARRFTAGETVTLKSSCDETSQWTARSVNPAMQKAAPAIIQGERG